MPKEVQWRNFPRPVTKLSHPPLSDAGGEHLWERRCVSKCIPAQLSLHPTQEHILLLFLSRGSDEWNALSCCKNELGCLGQLRRTFDMDDTDTRHTAWAVEDIRPVELGGLGQLRRSFGLDDTHCSHTAWAVEDIRHVRPWDVYGGDCVTILPFCHFHSLPLKLTILVRSILPSKEQLLFLARVVDLQIHHLLYMARLEPGH